MGGAAVHRAGADGGMSIKNTCFYASPHQINLFHKLTAYSLFEDIIIIQIDARRKGPQILGRRKKLLLLLG